MGGHLVNCSQMLAAQGRKWRHASLQSRSEADSGSRRLQERVR